MPSLSRFRRHFLPWGRAWLPQVAEWLAKDWSGSGPLDLTNVMAIVPTRQSARRLREALAEYAAQRGAAVFAPRTHTPDTLLTAGAGHAKVGSRLESLLAWTEVLRGVELEAFREVFPVAPPQRDFRWAWRLAENFFRLQTQLTESGLGFADVVSRVGDEFPEQERWRQLATLEQLQIEALAANDRIEPHAARREFARAPVLLPGVERIVVLGAPDPLPLALQVLEAWSEEVPVDVVIFAPAEEANAFDFAGRPVPAIWEQRVIALPSFERRVHLCADPGAEAERATGVVRRYARPDGMVALGVADAEVLPLLENALSRVGIKHYNPEGRMRRSESLHTLLTTLANLAREASFDTIAALARCPDFLACLRTRYGASFSAATFLKELDDLRARHLPADATAVRALNDGRRSTHFERGLRLIEELHAVLTQGAFPVNAVAALRALFDGRRFDLKRDGDQAAAAAVEAWRDVMRGCAEAQERFPALKTVDWWEVALRIYGDMRRTEEKPLDALDLQGWLELLWEDAPHLVVAGMNDGLVPDAIVGDPFLPESLRERLGLKSNAARFARDAYLLQAIAASRAREGRLELLFAKNSAVGDPLRPSRLLLRGDDNELPDRIALLFKPAEAVRPNLAWRRAWRIRPRLASPPARVPVTGLRTWLACPFRFYLTHVLRMDSVDAAKTEMDARDFGTLCHAALEAMAREVPLRDCVDETILRNFLLAEFDRAARKRYGDELTLPLVVQLESARQRLAKAAVVQARERASGWIVERVEAAFAIDVGGLEVRGKIDRIDRHEPSGAWRVLDYKTSDTATPPHRTHLRAFRPGDERLPPWMRVAVYGREMVWADLQLPVYLRALSRDLPAGAAVDCGYINLPKATGETALALWPELTGSLLDSARACADGVAAKILEGEFWPPAEIDPERDPFAALFHHGAEDSVEWRRQEPKAVQAEFPLELGVSSS